MTDTLRIKRRVAGGAAGAPASLVHAELAYNEVDDVLYYGKGAGAGAPPAATSIVAIGGLGAYCTLTGAQTISGAKVHTGQTDVPTVVNTDNSTKAASTAWVRGYAQPVSAQLTAVSAFVATGLVAQTAAGTFAARAITGTAGNIGVTNGDGIAGNPTFNLLPTGIVAGNYIKVTYDGLGRATAGLPFVLADVTAALGFTPENLANKGAANGYAGLDATGKVPLAQLPASVSGGLNYQGVWNAATNTPALVSGTGTKGFYYKVSVAGNTTIDGNANWTVGDLIIFDGTTWDKAEGGAPDVVSVAGRIGAVTLTSADITGLGALAALSIAPVVNGGTGVATLTGYVKGAGTANMTASATIPNTDITGLGTMSTQSAGAVAITGGTIDNVVIDGGTF